LGYIGELFYHYKDTKKIEAIIKDSKKKYKEITAEKRGNLAQNGDEFYKWYKEVVEDMPIVSCYALSNPLTGNYHGFLSILSKKGKTLTDKQLEANLKDLEMLKDRAREFMGKHSVKLASMDEVVMMAIDIAYGKEFDRGKFDRMFNQLMRREQWVIDWWEREAHEWKYRELRHDWSCDDSDEVSTPKKKAATKRPKKIKESKKSSKTRKKAKATKPHKKVKESKKKSSKPEKKAKATKKTEKQTNNGATSDCLQRKRPQWVEDWWNAQAHEGGYAQHRTFDDVSDSE
jgi:uncharacterized membrane protein YgaE (UPF0421/DUF939 family)